MAICGLLDPSTFFKCTPIQYIILAPVPVCSSLVFHLPPALASPVLFPLSSPFLSIISSLWCFYSLFRRTAVQRDIWGGFKNSRSTRGRENGEGREDGWRGGGGVERGSVSGSTLTNGSAELVGAPGSTDS